MAMRPGIKEFHRFIFGDFTKKLRRAYVDFQILSEADLQAVAWLLIREFLNDCGSGKNFKVLNKPYFKDLRIHPDIAVFRKDKPWLLVELKERAQITERSARKEWKRLDGARQRMRPKRGYLVYVARWGEKSALKGPKGRGARFFFEVPIILEELWTHVEVANWEKDFRKHAKFILHTGI